MQVFGNNCNAMFPVLFLKKWHFSITLLICIFKAMRHFPLLFICLLLNCCACAQQKEYVFKNLTMEDGLPSNETYHIFEDSQHYLWIATDLGVTRYDGVKFQTYNLPDNVIFKIREDKKGRIWFFSHKGLLAYFENGKIYPYKYNAQVQRRIQKMHIVDAWIDDAENIHLSSVLDSNYIFHPNGNITAISHNNWNKQIQKINITLTDAKNCFSDRYYSSHAEGDSIILTVKKDGRSTVYPLAIRFAPFAQYGSVTNGQGDVFFFGGTMLIKLKPDGSALVKKISHQVLYLYYRAGMLWAGLRKGGAIAFDENLQQVVTNNILSDKTVSSICMDYEGGLWFSTIENGTYYCRNQNVRQVKVDATQSYIDRVFSYNDSFLIYATRSWLHKLYTDTVLPLINLENLQVSDMVISNTKDFLIFGANGFNRSLILHPKAGGVKKYYFLPAVSEAAVINNDSIIFSGSTYTTSALSLLSFNFSNNFANTTKYLNKDGSPVIKLLNKPSKLFLDRDSNTVWLAANDGLYKSTPPFLSSKKAGKPGGLFDYGVSCIRKLESGWMAAGIRFRGVVIFTDPDSVINITEQDGLLSNKIKYLLPIKNQLWVATAKGLSVVVFSSFSPVAYRIINIGKNDGFYNITINQLIEYKKDIVAATSNGIYFIENPTAFLERKLAPIPFYISSISYYKGDTAGISSVTVPYSDSRVVIKYSAVSFNAGENMVYLYRFDDGDTLWRSTSNAERLIENLAPGTYTIQIKAGIPEQDRYSAIRTFTIIVQKPWWQNNWLRVLGIIIAAAMIYYFISRRVKKIQAEEKRKTALNAKLTELEQTALRSQMNPHFIFNCLTSIQQLIISGNKVDANEYLVKFSRLIRKTLEMSARPFISIREEKEYLEEYLLLEQLRLSGKFEYTVTADPSLNSDQTYIPNMMLQPIVENCVRHGIKSLEGRQGSIQVHFAPGNNTVVCSVTDNGVGRKSISSFNDPVFTKHKSYGMDIVRKRLETFSAFNQGESGIEIKDLFDNNENPSGTQVTVYLPYKSNL